MKLLFCFVILAVAINQAYAAKLTVTIFYETLCGTCLKFFKNQVPAVLQDPVIRKNVYFELVPYGKANYTENPWSITCQHGPNECLGNVMNACFLARNPDNYKQMAFVTCCMSDPNPPTAGEKCAKQLGYSFEGIKECMGNKEGIQLQIKYGRRTLDFTPKITWVPTIVYDNVYTQEDSRGSEKDFKAVITKKLKLKGVLV